MECRSLHFGDPCMPDDPRELSTRIIYEQRALDHFRSHAGDEEKGEEGRRGGGRRVKVER